MKEHIQQLIASTAAHYAKIKKVDLPQPLAFDVAISKGIEHGDFASNIAFKLAGLVRQPPHTVAKDLTELMLETRPRSIQRIEVGGAGFLNFYLAKTSLMEVLCRIREEDQTYGRSKYGEGKRVVVEFVSANPTGPLTIAHGRQAVLGDCLVRMLRAAGFHADAEYYLNDAGRQMNLLGESAYARYCEQWGEKVALPEDGYQGEYLKEIAAKLAAREGRKWLGDFKGGAGVARTFAQDEIMEGIRADLDRVDVHFDSYFHESSLAAGGEIERALKDLKAKGHLYEKDGALWFQSTAFGDDKDRVVRKSTGEFTYLAPDIAYHRHKFQRGYQWLINLLGPDHHGYVPRLKAACRALGHRSEELDIRIVQLTTLYRKGEPVRMSTRAGEFVTLRELLDEVGRDATRFFFIMRRIESHLDFDLDLARQKSQENPVYYLQYAHARIAGILRHAGRAIDARARTELLTAQEETDLVRRLCEFADIVTAACQQLEPYRVADYLRELATSFHKFYTEHRVLSQDPALTDARLLLTDAVRIVMRNGLTLLGISQPETM